MVNDGSTDSTEEVLVALEHELDRLWHVTAEGPHGFGFAIRLGLDRFRGDVACIVMADMSDSPDDIVVYHDKMCEGWECVFGSRFISGAFIKEYPMPKLILNRLANTFIRLLFRTSCNDVTNAFKCYRREVVDGLRPFLSCHFNITVELPLKAIARGYTWTVVPISWTGRVHGVSKLRIKEMGSRYLFIVLYVLIEKWLSRGDYHREGKMASPTLSSAQEREET